MDSPPNAMTCSPKSGRWLAVVLPVAAALFAAPGASASSNIASKGGEAVRASAALDFAVTVPRVMRLRLLNHPASVEVTADDIRRGRVAISGTSLDIAVNDRAGYDLRAELSSPYFTGVRIEGLHSRCDARPHGCVARIPSMVGKPVPAPMPVLYELKLSPDMAPGRYAWPVSMSMQAP